MAYVNRVSGLGLMPWQTDAIERARESTVATSERGFLFPLANTRDTTQSLLTSLAAKEPSLREKITTAEPSSFIRALAPTLPMPAKPPASLLRSIAVSLPIPRHNDQAIKPIEPAAVTPALTNQPVIRPVIGKPAPVTVSDWFQLLTRSRQAAIKPIAPVRPTIQTGADPTREQNRRDWSGDSTGLTIAEPKPPANVVPSRDGLQFSEMPVQPTQPTSPAQAQTFLDIAGLSPMAKIAIVGLGVFFLFGSAKKQRRNPCRRR